MNSLTLGNSSLKVSRLAYGCWRIGDLTRDRKNPVPDEAAGRRAVIAAYEAGYTFFDHADIYSDGRGELIFGQALRMVLKMRSEVVITTKCGIRKPDDPTPGAPYRYDFSASYVIRSCERSLKRLGVDTIDVFQLHRPDFLMDPAEVAGAFAKLHRQGKVREFGVSNFSSTQFTALQRACPMKLVCNQIEISLAQQERFSDGTLDQCLAEKITPLAWSPLAGGRLADGGKKVLRWQEKYPVSKVVKVLDLLAAERNVSRAAVALAWLLKHPAGIVPIVGSTDRDRIEDCAGAVNVELSREEWYRLLTVARGEPLP
ncbi:MAG: aldo/keto reductase [Verrucomicrobia bacterium]|nr:aldo/keto reductase [Verrucomicrobiota bacterium]